MILYCHQCYMDGDWVEDISGNDFSMAQLVSESEFGFGDLVYIGF